MRSTIKAALALGVFSLTSAAQPMAQAQAIEHVQASDLRALDAWQVGQAGPEDVTLPPTLWRNSDAAAVGALFDKLSGPFASPAAMRLARAVLLSGGDAPAGEPAAANDAAHKRFAALARFGAADEIVAMTSVSPKLAADPDVFMLAAQADLARGRPTDACRRAQASADAGAFVLSLRAFCAAAAGQSAAADVALDVARAGGAKDAWLLAAIPAINGLHGPGARYDNAFDAAISLAAKLRAPRSPLAKSSVLALETIARTSEAPALLRASAAQAALLQGALSGADARAAIEPAATPKPGKATPSFAAALHAITGAPSPAAKAKAIQTALARAPGFADFTALARLLHDDITALPKDASTAGAAWSFTRAMLAAADVKGAIAWRDFAAQGAAQSPIGPQRGLDCALVAAGGGDEATARAAIEARLQLSGVRQARDAVLLGALGLPLPARAGEMIAATPDGAAQKPADPAILADLVAASQRGAAGETALIAARAIAPGAYKLDRASVVSVIEALRAVGLDALARRVALEAMIGAGLE